MSESFTERVQKVKLTSKEKIIVEKIMENLSKTAFLSGVELAEGCGVSATLITRFAKKLGYSRISEFKKDLEELYRQTTTPYEVFQDFITGNVEKEIYNITIAQDLHNIASMQKQLDKEVLENVINNIEKCNTVYIAAMFASEGIAHIFGYYLKRLEKPCIELTGIGLSKMIEYSDISSQDVLIAISSQKILKEVRDAVLYAKNHDIKTIAITDSTTNPLARISDMVLVAPVNGATFDYTHSATISMINVIVNTLAAKNSEEVSKKLENTKKRWIKKQFFCS